MEDNYDLAKPDPALRSNEAVMGMREDLTGFRAGEDRIKSAPELLEENRRLRELLAGNLIEQQAILHIRAEDGSEWICGVVMTNLRKEDGSDTWRTLRPGDVVTGLRVVEHG